MSSKAEMEMHVLMYAHQRLKNGHLNECLDLGFDLESLQIIHNLDLAALARLDVRRKLGVMAGITIDKAALFKLARDLEENAKWEATADQLLRHGASNVLLRHFLGARQQDVTNRRRLLNLPPNPRGRLTRDVSTTSEECLILHRLSRALERRSDRERVSALIQCQLLLNIAAETGYGINEIWAIVEAHIESGTFSWRDPHPSDYPRHGGPAASRADHPGSPPCGP